MKFGEHVPLAPLTTLGVGGKARFFIEAHSEEDVKAAIARARECGLPVLPLGGGSNLLVPDAGVDGVVVKVMMRDIACEEGGAETLLVAGAGASWETVVDTATSRGLFGIENLAGIPGTIGGAAVQNIGAYGAELAGVFAYADTVDAATGSSRRIARDEAAFGYRTSFFKNNRSHIVTRVALRLSTHASPNISYPDLLRAQEEGVSLTAPVDIAKAVRAIRARKFPKQAEEGSAGSFFKNPVISRELASALAERFPGMPQFPQPDGTVKVSLAWLLDRALSLKGFSKGNARLYEKHPLVIVARAGARAADIDALAKEVAELVRSATGIAIEREVETFGAR
ncbi:MAG: UDP-N-acetylmuramate dehydrogenase [Patescibacteria group bacterium]|nr:UDP-N-acetylmuramate dehydrogenase [Patescibacteria group bacterium]